MADRFPPGQILEILFLCKPTLRHKIINSTNPILIARIPILPWNAPNISIHRHNFPQPLRAISWSHTLALYSLQIADL
jgi:hypothetical protein